MNSLTTATLLQWDSQYYGTGFTHIDEQHHELFDGLNSLTLFLQKAPAADEIENQDKVIELLYFLGEYVLRGSGLNPLIFIFLDNILFSHYETIYRNKVSVLRS